MAPKRKAAAAAARKPAGAGSEPKKPEKAGGEAEPPPTPPMTQQVRTVKWTLHIGSESPMRLPEYKADIVDEVVVGRAESRLGFEDEAESTQSEEVVDARIQKQSSLDDTLNDALWVSPTRHHELTGNVDAAVASLVQIRDRISKEAEAIDRAKRNSARTSDDGDFDVAANEILQEINVEAEMAKLLEDEQRDNNASSREAALSRQLLSSSPVKGKKPSSQQGGGSVFDESLFSNHYTDDLVDGGQPDPGLQVKARVHCSEADGALKKCQMFKDWTEADIAVRAAGARTGPFRILEGGRPAKRVYVCSHPTMSGFPRRRSSKRSTPVEEEGAEGDGAEDDDEKKSRGGIRQSGDGDDRMSRLLNAIEANRCSGFVQLQMARAATILAGKQHK